MQTAATQIKSFFRTRETATPALADSWLTAPRFALFLGMLVFASFPAVLLGQATFVFRDFAVFSYPVAFYHKESFWRGELPFWNPYNYCGIPFLAQWNTMVLYPLSLIYLLLPLTWSLPFFCLAHMWWGGLGMYFLAYRWTGSRLAAGLAGVIFSFNGLMQNFLMWPSHAATFGWVPWVLWLVPEGWRCGGRKLILAVLVASMQMLAGGPETILFTWLLLLLLAGTEWLQSIKNREIRETHERTRFSCLSCISWFLLRLRTDLTLRNCRIPLRFVSIAILVSLVCAAQLLPFLQLLMNSSRDARTASAGFDWPMPIWGWANFLVPMFRTVPSSQGVFFQLQQSWTSSYYAGIGTVFFAGIAVWRSRDWRVKALAASALAALILACGDAGFVYRALHTCMPALGFVRYPVKFVIPVLAVAPLLAAVGFQRMLVRDERKYYWEWTWGVVLILLVGGIVALDSRHPIPQDSLHLTAGNGLARAAFLVLSILSAIAVSKSRGYRQVLCGVLLILIAWYDLFTHVPNQNPTAEPQIYTAGWAKAQLNPDSLPELGEGRVMLRPAADEALRYNALPAPGRDAFVKRLAFFCDANLLDQVPQTYGLFSLAPAGIGNLANLPYVHTNVPVSNLLDFMAVSRTTASGTLCDWCERSTAMPLATAGQAPVFADQTNTVAALLQTNTDFRGTVFVPKDALSFVAAGRQPGARVLSRHFETHKIALRTEAPAATLVVVSQSYYPAWKAYVDKKRARIYRANYAFQALEVPGGTHEVVLRYEDDSFMAGAFLSCLGLAVSWLWWKLAKCGLSPLSARSQAVHQAIGSKPLDAAR